MMRTRQEYIDILKSHANVLRANYDISYMRLFGSVAKDEHHEGSDVDLFVVMPPKAYNICAAADYLESILGANVDLIRKHNNMRPFFLNQIDKYGIDIFGKAWSSARHPSSEIPWHQVFGLRNRIAYGYFDIDVDVISEVINEDLQPLMDATSFFIDYFK